MSRSTATLLLGLAPLVALSCSERRVEKTVKTVRRELRAAERQAQQERQLVARNAPIEVADLTGEWISNYEGGRNLKLRGKLVNRLGEPLEYACTSKIVIHVRGKAAQYEDEGDWGNGCGGAPTGLSVGKTKSFSNYAPDEPEVTKQLRQYDIERIDWTLSVRAWTPLGARYEWTARTSTLPAASTRERFGLAAK